MLKLSEYIPVMIVTNISILLINTVDQIVAGNFIGDEAMSSISIFGPITLVISVFSGPVASGISTTISNALGERDMDKFNHTKSAGLQIVITITICISLIQIPMVFLLISTYGLSDEVLHMVREYAIGMMICTPLGIVSTVGTYVMQIAGKMRILMVLSIIEGVSNVAFDLLYVAVLDMGVAGAGFGSATANLIRCVLTVIFLLRSTSTFKGDGNRATLRDYRDILSLGLPDAAYTLMVAFQNYFTLRIILHAFGEDGGVVYGLCGFCLSLANVVLFGIQGGLRPLMGLFAGEDDLQGITELLRQGFRNVAIRAGILIAAIMLFPEFFYHIHGIDEIPDGGILAVQLYSAAFLFRGFDHIFRLYFSNMKDIRFATTLTLLASATLPLFALIISTLDVPSAYIFLSYILTETIIFVLSSARCIRLRRQERKNISDDIVLYMTVKKDEADEASEYVKDFADDHDIDPELSSRMALCVKNMVGFIRVSDEFSLIPHDRLTVDLIIRFQSHDKALFISLDDGANIALDKDTSAQGIIADNYRLIKSIAKSIEYQYVLNMNYTRITL